MKNVIALFGWMVVLVMAVFLFVFFSQKQRDERDIQMAEMVAKQSVQKQMPVIGLPVEKKRLGEKMLDGAKSAIAFVLSIFAKV